MLLVCVANTAEQFGALAVPLFWWLERPQLLAGAWEGGRPTHLVPTCRSWSC